MYGIAFYCIKVEYVPNMMAIAGRVAGAPTCCARLNRMSVVFMKFEVGVFSILALIDL